LIAGTDPNDDNSAPHVEIELEGFETGDLLQYPWLTSGNNHWTVTDVHPKDGVYSAESRDIGQEQITSLEINLYCKEGEISFAYSLDSESGSDYLKFYVDGILKDQWSGTIPYSYANYALADGMHHFSWVYEKDESGSGGGDKAWIDEIVFPGSADSDTDGMPDGWEFEHNLNYFIDDSLNDPDLDLFLNIKEYQYNTDPNVSNLDPDFSIGIDAEDQDNDGKDMAIFIDGFESGIFSGSDLEDFALEFGK